MTVFICFFRFRIFRGTTTVVDVKVDSAEDIAGGILFWKHDSYVWKNNPVLATLHNKSNLIPE